MKPKMTRKQAKILGNVYRGYIPPDLPQNRPRNPIKPWWRVIGKPMLTMYPPPEVEEWSEKPEYPPLNDASKSGLRRQVRLDWYDSIKAKPTAEQKLHEITTKITHNVAHIYNWLPSHYNLPFVKYLTQTHTIKSLPVGYDSLPSDRLTKIRDMVLDQIALSKYESKAKEDGYFVSRPNRDQNKRTHLSNRLIEQIINQARKFVVVDSNPQLLDYQLDLSPVIRSWWYHSGFEAPNKKHFYKSRKDEDGNINTIFQMDGASALNMRSEHLMEPIVDTDDTLVTDTTLIEKCNYDPRFYGARYKFRPQVALPGFWFEETPKYDCPHTCFLSTDCLKTRQSVPWNLASHHDDTEECLTGQAILTAFGWLNSLSMYHGFTPFHELHYPLTCQVVTTDGQNWMFNVFQLNSHTFHRDLGGPKKNNICWSSGVMKLYDEYRDGNFQGVNDEVISLLVKFMAKQTNPEYTSQLNLRPYLHEDQETTEEDRAKIRHQLRDRFEHRVDRWFLNKWNVPEWERIFFQSKVTRHQITHMKPPWHPPKPKVPNVFE